MCVCCGKHVLLLLSTGTPTLIVLGLWLIPLSAFSNNLVFRYRRVVTPSEASSPALSLARSPTPSSPTPSDASTEVDVDEVLTGESEENKAFHRLSFALPASPTGLSLPPHSSGLFHHFSVTLPTPPPRPFPARSASRRPPHILHPQPLTPQAPCTVAEDVDNTIAQRKEQKRLRRKARREQRQESMREQQRRESQCEEQLQEVQRELQEARRELREAREGVGARLREQQLRDRQSEVQLREVQRELREAQRKLREAQEGVGGARLREQQLRDRQSEVQLREVQRELREAQRKLREAQEGVGGARLVPRHVYMNINNFYNR